MRPYTEAFEQLQQGLWFELAHDVNQQVLAGVMHGDVAAVRGDFQTRAHPLHQWHAARIVALMARPFHHWRGGLAQVVQQRSAAHFQRETFARADIHAHQRVHEAIDFRVIVSALRHAVECGEFGDDFLQSTAGVQHLEESARLIVHQRAGHLLPDAFWHQRIHLTRLNQLAAERHRFRL